MSRLDRIVARNRMASRPRRVIERAGERVLGWPFHATGSLWWKYLRDLAPKEQAAERAARKRMRITRYLDRADRPARGKA